MTLEIALYRSETPEEAFEKRKSYDINFHHFEYWFQERKQISGVLGFGPGMSTVFMPTSGDQNLRQQVKAIAEERNQSSDDVLARFMLQTPSELLERKKGLRTCLRNAFPEVGDNRAKLTALGQVIAPAIVDYTTFYEDIAEMSIGGKELVDALLLEQGKLFPLDYYVELETGICVEDTSLQFVNPPGMLKGMLLRKGYETFQKKGTESVWYAKSSEISPEYEPVEPF